MKKIIISIVVLFVAFNITTFGQRATSMLTVAGDTVITSASLDTVSKVITATAGYSALGIQVNATKVSGTITAKAYLYGSLDGTNYVVTDSASSAFTNTAGLQSVFFTKTAGTPFVYYKVMVRNVGGTTSTESLAVKVYYVLRRFNQ